jgi:hypothetical protein
VSQCRRRFRSTLESGAHPGSVRRALERARDGLGNRPEQIERTTMACGACVRVNAGCIGQARAVELLAEALESDSGRAAGDRLRRAGKRKTLNTDSLDFAATKPGEHHLQVLERF